MRFSLLKLQGTTGSRAARATVIAAKDDLLGPTPDTAYRDAFRVLQEEPAAAAHSRTAVTHVEGGRSREAVLSARLALEMASGGGGADVKRRLDGPPKDDSTADTSLLRGAISRRPRGRHKSRTAGRLEAIRAMKRPLNYLEVKTDQPWLSRRLLLPCKPPLTERGRWLPT